MDKLGEVWMCSVPVDICLITPVSRHTAAVDGDRAHA